MWRPITLRFTGTSPLLQHNPDGMQKLKEKQPNGKGATKAGKYIPEPAEEAEWSCYRADDGTLYHPAEAFRDAMIDAATGYTISAKVNGRDKQVAAGGKLKAGLMLTEEAAPLFDPENEEPLTVYVIDTRRAVVQKQGIQRSRAKLLKWATEVQFEYDDDLLSEDVVLQFATYGGRYVGVGDYRPKPPAWSPGRGGPFGRFTAEVVED